jgi:hypothetical protein
MLMIVSPIQGAINYGGEDEAYSNSNHEEALGSTALRNGLQQIFSTIDDIERMRPLARPKAEGFSYRLVKSTPSVGRKRWWGAMKPIAIAIPLLFLVVQAQAQERRDIAGLSCAEVQALLKQDGTTVIRYRSIFNLSLTRYDLYVSGQKQCGPGEVATGAGVPTTDTDYCPVHKCIASNLFVAR